MHQFFNNKSCAIFDFDGTLVDSQKANYDLECNILKEYGATISEEKYNDLGGLTYTDLAAHLVKEFNLPLTAQQYFDKRQKLFFDEYVPNFKETKGALTLLQQLKAKGFKVGIASASSPDVFDCFFKHNPQYKMHVDAVVTCDELRISKPNPLVYLECIKRIGGDATQAVIFEDTFVGLTGAKATGCPICCVLSSTDKETQKRSMSDLTIKDFTELIV